VERQDTAALRYCYAIAFLEVSECHPSRTGETRHNMYLTSSFPTPQKTHRQFFLYIGLNQQVVTFREVLTVYCDNFTHGAEPLPNFLEIRGYLPRSQEPSTGPILRQINPVRTTQTYHSKIHFISVHYLRPGLSSGLFPYGFPTNILYSPPFVLHVPPISSSLT
jgi:hypothetical protein